ncbi:NorM family multidrug efflux MATE transporter [Pseudomonas sp. 21LCFQ02]|uniref:NorM family multidrug efflux MATE transporter n=1 Tax=unclassified Pseudomonas TaxID=196821 RepID=UPI0004F67E16|nr:MULTISPECIES: NorM family multidrug efflux MATE transporter [unclassified Pseudomonas]MCO8162521.1 NorM family multidrug efflux MATE transporter [Pseudomonas sp. 21LCFQ010]MCO8167004.1 NorM family multidrug efflux MATE transporter [Pseudomonas sp. 21LCFQ02]MCQ9425910.1 NorM family multidrug efflux MATE transporter [Pseudomonas sp. LJDD11]BAP42257.1 multidrug efflux protein NorA [Pseudomonas sp. StFLB209]
MQPAALKELWTILRLAGPLIASQLAHMLMVFTDTVMMGKLGPDALAGGGLGAATYNFVTFFCIGVMAAVGTLVAIRQGAGDTEGATRLTQAGLWLAWGMAVVAAVVLWNLEPLLLHFGQTPNNVHMAMQFLSTLPLALPGLLSFMALRGFTSALGRAGPVMVISLVGAAANFVLNYALIEGWFGLPHLGLWGIGLVTAVVTNAMAIALALHIRRHPAYDAYPIRAGLGTLSRSHLSELWRLGLPIGGTYAVEVGLFTFAAFCMGALGTTQMAAHQIALQTISMAFMIPVGISYAVTMRIGKHYGAGDLLMARTAGRVGIGFGGALMLLFALLFWLAPRTIVGLFLDINDPAFNDIVVLAVKLLAIAAWFELFDGTQTIAMGAIRGLKDAKTTFLIGLGCYWLIAAPAAWLLGFQSPAGAEGVWWGLALGLLCAAATLTWAFERRMAKMLRRADRQPAKAA